MLPLIFSLTFALALTPPDKSTEPPQTPKLPDSPAGKALALWLEAFNSGKPDTMKEFLKSHLAPSALEKRPFESWVEEYHLVHDDARGLVLDRVTGASDHEITAEARVRMGLGAFRVRMKVTDAAPHGITEFRLQRLPQLPPSGAAPKRTDAQIATEIDQLVRALVAADKFSGVVVVTHAGKTVYERAVGQASKAHGVANRIDTKFNLGSMNKMFTAVAVVQLAEAGKLRLDDPIGRYVTGLSEKTAQTVTIRHLLAHTSGLGSFLNDQFDAQKAKLRTVTDFLPLVADETLAFMPGEKFAYSNTGFLLLGAAVEKASGQDYFAYVKKHIYQPAGMADTDAFEIDADVPNLATGYTRTDIGGKFHPGPWRNNVLIQLTKGGPAGGGYSTAPDLTRFAAAFIGGKLVPHRAVRTLTQPRVDAFPGTKYGYGFMITNVRTHSVVGHGGGFPGVSTRLDMYPDLDYTVVVLSNYDRAATPVFETLRDLIAR
ncbi:serine hydrolase domain-containing protein [Frigoriglobus tundricola]|uniref:Beta-lactamase class C-like and penicillin binding proteins (PBPs) superfamily n=1 Tax=Frigoriglobus tundricola TaxID=2774151 RepID=A0A6M5YQV6_9BACT|nr:serine hydrolase domain-containing protein [Frigoriglobus tundricola]QJW96369.1 Beta-lactamase class C-like and penicillin binding proteins (PBPs) superfamily [Frigoriglobus tundricola]